MSGYVRVSRGFFEDAAFADEPHTEREAFLWLIFEASFKAREVRVGSVVVALERGQLAASTRFMAKAWGWSEARVRRYFDRLKNRRMIECVADAGITVVTLCNYDKYQADERVADAPATQQPTQQRRTGDANKKEDEIREEEGGGGVAHARDPEPPSVEAPGWTDAEYGQLLTAAGIDPSKDITGKWLGSTQRWEADRWRRDLGMTLGEAEATIREACGTGPPGSLRYFAAAMQRAAGRKQAEPLAPIVPLPQRTEGPHVRPSQPARQSRSTEAVDAFLAGASRLPG